MVDGGWAMGDGPGLGKREKAEGERDGGWRSSRYEPASGSASDERPATSCEIRNQGVNRDRPDFDSDPENKYTKVREWPRGS